MKILLLTLGLLAAGLVPALGQQTPAATEAALISLSKDKWQWMADKNVDKLATLFNDKSMFCLLYTSPSPRD